MGYFSISFFWLVQKVAGEFLANHLETSFEKIDYKTDPEGGISLPVPPFFMFFSSQVLIET